MMKKYIESFSVFLLLYTFYLGPLFGPILTIYLLFFTSLWPFVMAYLSFMYMDRNTPMKGGRKSRILRNLFLWKYFRDYFPQKIVKTAEINPSSNHFFCMFPHGLTTTAGIAHFANDTSKATELFPGISIFGLTLNLNFYVPFFREFVMGYGMISVSKESIINGLSGTKGNVFIIYPGGSAEAAKSQPGKNRVAIKNRKGLIRLAIITGTNLVPVFAFGEVDLFDQSMPSEGSTRDKIKKYIRKKTGVSLGWVSGAGFLGLLPRRKPVTTIVGKPIIVDKNENPTEDEVNKLHGEFLEKLVCLFEEHKANYLENPGSAFLSIED